MRDAMRDENVTPKVTLCDALEGETEGDADKEAEEEYPGWLPFWSVSQDAEIHLFAWFSSARSRKNKESFVSVLTD